MRQALTVAAVAAVVQQLVEAGCGCALEFTETAPTTRLNLVD